MDANGTRHHLLQGADDWQRCFDVDPVGAGTLLFEPVGQVVRLRRLVPEFVAAAEDHPPQLDQRRGAADRDEPADDVAVGGRAAGHHLRPVVSGGGDVGDSDARVARLAVLQYGGGISVTDRGLFPDNDGLIAIIVGVVILAAVVVSSGAVALAVMAAQAVR